ncbi:hypothetical protein V6N13_055479 [Hibiscus sabdariffa]
MGAKQSSVEGELHIASKANANAQLLKPNQLAALNTLIVTKNVILKPTTIFVLTGNVIAELLKLQQSVVSVTPIVIKNVILNPIIIFVSKGIAFVIEFGEP